MLQSCNLLQILKIVQSCTGFLGVLVAGKYKLQFCMLISYNNITFNSCALVHVAFCMSNYTCRHPPMIIYAYASKVIEHK